MSGEKVKKQDMHNIIRRNSEDIHEIFKVLTPGSGDVGARLRGFSKIMMEGKIDRNSNELKKELGLDTRGGRKSVIDAFKKAGFITEKNNELIATKLGKKIWNSLIKFIEYFDYIHFYKKDENILTINNLNEAFEIIRNSKDTEEAKNKFMSRFNSSPDPAPFYDKIDVVIFTDGKKITKYFWHWYLINTGKDPIHSHVCKAESGAIMEKNKFRLKHHSKNISDYKMHIDEPDNKKFELSFSEPVLPNQSLDYWYSYDWPGTYDYDWPEWDIRFLLESYPCKSFNVILQMPNNCAPKEKSFKIRTSGTKEFCRFLGEQKTLYPIVLRNDRVTNLLWFLMNVPTMMKFRFAWEYSLV